MKNITQKISKSLLFVLCAFLPFHAFFVTIGSKYLLNSDKDTLPFTSFFLASWKEVLFIFLCILGLSYYKKHLLKKWSFLDTTIALFIGWHLIFALYQYLSSDTSLLQTIWGLRANLQGFLIFWIIRLFAFSKQTFHCCIKILLIATTISFTLGILQMTLSCENLTFLGYTPYKSSWVASKPLPCGHGIGDNLSQMRIMGTFSGPNQLASFLIITLFLLYYSFQKKLLPKYIIFSFGAIHFAFLILTRSRGALLGLICAGIFLSLYKYWSFIKKHWWKFITISFCCFLGFTFLFQGRIESTQEHFTKPLEGIQRVIKNPFGYGIGKAGPVSMRFPADGSKAFISENWYIQIAEETGVVGFVLMILLFISLFLFLQKKKDKSYIMLKGIFIALCINSLFLHTWSTDSITTIVFFLLLGMSYEKEIPLM